MLLKGKKFLVTGAASGLGRATAMLLASQGAILLLIDKNQEELNRVARETSGIENALSCDLLSCDWGG